MWKNYIFYAKRIIIMASSTKSLLLLSIFLILAFAAYLFYNPSNHLSGKITTEFVAKLQGFDDMQVVKISSSGGDPDYAELAAKIIQEKRLSFIVEGFCGSSCVEYLLPAAVKLQFSDKPILAVHQNPAIFDKYKNSNPDFLDRPLCYFEDNLDYYFTLQAKKNNEFIIERAITETISKLNVKDFILSDKGRCVEVGLVFENQLWLPNSNQLRTILGLDFTGPVCADDFEDCSKSLNKVLPDNFSVVIGSKEYTVVHYH